MKSDFCKAQDQAIEDLDRIVSLMDKYPQHAMTLLVIAHIITRNFKVCWYKESTITDEALLSIPSLSAEEKVELLQKRWREKLDD